MELKDFEPYSDFNDSWISKDKYLFDNGKVCFYYRWYLSYFTKQCWDGNDSTEYTVSLMVDNDSVHETRKDDFPPTWHTFVFKKAEKTGEFDINILIKTLNSAIKLKIEPKIKVDNYKKIKEILNGFEYDKKNTSNGDDFTPYYLIPSDYNDCEEQAEIRNCFLSIVDENKHEKWFDKLIEKAKILSRNDYFSFCEEQDIDDVVGYNVYEYLRGPFKNEDGF